MKVMIVGKGRAGGSFADALAVVGVDVTSIGRASGTISGAGYDLVLLCVSDDAIAEVASRVDAGDAVVAHCAGSHTLDVLGPHERVASIHPLMSLPDTATGSARLRDGCTFAVAGDPMGREVVERLGGLAIEVPDERRALYHAAASVAASHLVALCAQVERLAAEVGVPADAYWRLMSMTLDNVGRLGARAALTGPVARDDEATLAAHVAALPPDERPLYEALMSAARSLAVDDV